jgi:hypothetical protein
MEKWKHGDIDVRHRNLKTWRHGQGDMDRETWTRRYGQVGMDIDIFGRNF